MSWDTELPEDLKQYEEELDTVVYHLDGDSRDKISLIKVVAEIFDKKSAIEILGYFARKSVYGRYYIEALAEIGNERAIEFLEDLAKNNAILKCENAILALGEIGGEKATNVLVELVHDNSDNKRKYAAKALGKIGNKKAVRSLSMQVYDEDSTTVVTTIFEALAEAENSKAVNEIAVEAICDLKSKGNLNSYDKEYYTAKGLATVGSEKALEKLRNLARQGCWKAIELLGEVEDRDAVELLIEIAQDKTRESRNRSEAAKSLGKIGDDSTLKALRGLTTDKESKVRSAAKKAIDKIIS